MVVAALIGCASPESSPPAASMIVVPFEDARFVPVNPTLPTGPQLAVLRGDPATGPSAMLMKLVRGSVPLHTHSADYHLVLIRGTMKHWGAGESEAGAVSLGPGSYWFQPGNTVHGDACLVDECLVQIVWAGPRDAQLASEDAP